MKVIVVTHRIRDGYGLFAAYYRLSKSLGVKVLQDYYYESIQELKDSCIWDKAKTEANYYHKAYASGVVPKCYGVRPVKDDGWYYAGILLTHLQGKPLWSVHGIPYAYKGRYSVNDYLESALEAVGICHGDLHGGNIIVTIKQGHICTAYAIDFSADRASLSG